MAKKIEHRIRDSDGAEVPNLLFILSQEGTASREVVVNNIEDLAFDSFDQSRQDNGVGAIIHIGQRKSVAAAEVEEKAKRVDSHRAWDRFLPATENDARPDRDARQAVLPVVISDQFILLKLGIDIGVVALFQVRFNFAALVQHSSWLEIHVGMNGKGADVDQPNNSALRDQGIQQIAGRDHGILVTSGKRFASSSDKMKNNPGVPGRGGTMFTGEQIAGDDLNLGRGILFQQEFQ